MTIVAERDTPCWQWTKTLAFASSADCAEGQVSGYSGYSGYNGYGAYSAYSGDSGDSGDSTWMNSSAS